MRTDAGRNLIRLPDVLRTSRRALFPRFISAGRYDALHPLILWFFLHREKAVHHCLSLLIGSRAGHLFHVNFLRYGGLRLASKRCLKDQGICCHRDDKIVLILHQLI